MSRQEPGIVRLGLTLALFAATACVLLAFVYQGTRPNIERNQQEKLNKTLRELFSDADRFSGIPGGLQSPDPAVRFEEIYEVHRGGDRIGLALRVSRGSYGGPLKALVGVNAGGTIAGVRILEHSDTPGLGANATSPSFTGQFDRKPVGDAFVVRADVEAITASTITSKAVADAVKAAGQAASRYLEAAGE